MIDYRVKELAEHLLQTGYDDLPERERRILARIAKRLVISQNVNDRFHERLSFGDHLADRVAAFGGSWSFIILFGLTLAAWVLINSPLAAGLRAFDPYPFIFLNLILSMLAAIQAPVIMMSQNRQASKDRLAAANDYEVNLKAELEIIALHEKIDELREQKFTALIEQQREMLSHQQTLMRQLRKSRAPTPTQTRRHSTLR